MKRTLDIFQYRGAPVRLHYSVLFVVPFYFFFYREITYAPIFAVFLIVLLLLHELGHAYIAKRLRVDVYEIEVFFLFGVCRHKPPRSQLQAILIAWGGVLAQLVALIIALILLELAPAIQRMVSYGYKANDVLNVFSHVFIRLNILMLFINLVPAKGLDGFLAWDILPYLRRNRLFSRTTKRPATKVDVSGRERAEERARKATDQIIVKFTRKK